MNTRTYENSHIYSIIYYSLRAICLLVDAAACASDAAVAVADADLAGKIVCTLAHASAKRQTEDEHGNWQTKLQQQGMCVQERIVEKYKGKKKRRCRQTRDEK